MSAAILPEYVGYLVVIAFGGVFSIITAVIAHLEDTYVTKHAQTSESFNTAGRSVGTGLIAAVIVSQWTWAATLLQSSTVAHQYGISGPFWYAAGASVQVLLFSVMAIQVKRNAPNAHTFLEIMRTRYGYTTHKVYLFFGLITNIMVTAMLLLGGSVVVHRLTGMPIVTAAFLIPVGVIGYTMHGGLKASFISAYIHTAIIYAMLLVFISTVYIFSPRIGSPSTMYSLLSEASTSAPLAGNSGGSYLTMASTGGLIFGVINLVGNFGTIFVDQGYWQSAIASQPHSSVKGFLIGGLSWFAIPFSLATSIGLASVALKITLTHQEVSEGLVVPVTVVELMGTAGAVAVLTMLFMAVTSAGSAELIAVSSLITYDVYWTYINPHADGRKLLKVSRIAVVIFGLMMGCLAVILLHVGLSLGYIYLLMGVVIGCAVVPVAATITWTKAHTVPVTLAPVIGLTCGLGAWLVSAKTIFGTLDLKSTGDDIPLLIGNTVSFLVGGVVVVIGSLLCPANFDFEITRTQIKQITDSSDSNTGSDSNKNKEIQSNEHDSHNSDGTIKLEELKSSYLTENNNDNNNNNSNNNNSNNINSNNNDNSNSSGSNNNANVEDEQQLLLRSLRFSIRAGVAGVLVLCMLWPMPLFFSRYVFSRYAEWKRRGETDKETERGERGERWDRAGSPVSFFAWLFQTIPLLLLYSAFDLLSLFTRKFSRFFTGWIALSFIWSVIAACTIIFMPLIQARGAFKLVLLGLIQTAKNNDRTHEVRGGWVDVMWGAMSGVGFPLVSCVVIYFLNNTILMLFSSLVSSSLLFIVIGSILIGFLTGTGPSQDTLADGVGAAFLIGGVMLLVSVLVYFGRKMHKKVTVWDDMVDEFSVKSLKKRLLD